MTYLQLVNKILRRMREAEVSMVAETPYSLLVGEFVNDAKRKVEDSWAWRALIDSVTFPTVAGTASYDLEDFNCDLSGTPPRENARLYIDSEASIPLIRMTTTGKENYILKVPQSTDFVSQQVQMNLGEEATPSMVYFTSNQSAADGLTNLRVRPMPTPDAAYNIQIFLVNPQNDLEEDDDVLLVPSFPVVQLAYLYTLYERGEELGEVLTLTSEKADSALADAVMNDSALTTDLIFRAT